MFLSETKCKYITNVGRDNKNKIKSRLSVSLQSDTSGAFVGLEAADLQDEVDEEEEQERHESLLQRQKLVEGLGVVDKVHELLQSRAEGGGLYHYSTDIGYQSQHQRRDVSSDPGTDKTVDVKIFTLSFIKLFLCVADKLPNTLL